jgi:DNA-binding transcriptional ArsR family regulator
MAVGSQRQVRIQPFVWDKVAGDFAPAADPIGADETRLESIEMKTQRRHNRFLKGPVPWDWIARAYELPGRALIVGLCLWRLSGALGNRTVTLGNAELKPFGIDRASKSRALDALEKAGLIRAERKPGRWPIVTLLT